MSPGGKTDGKVSLGVKSSPRTTANFSFAVALLHVSLFMHSFTHVAAVSISIEVQRWLIVLCSNDSTSKAKLWFADFFCAGVMVRIDGICLW